MGVKGWTKKVEDGGYQGEFMSAREVDEDTVRVREDLRETYE